jgi:hypothetical protein
VAWVFTFQVTWNLTDASPDNTLNASHGNTFKNTPLTIGTTNGKAGYSTLSPISLTGIEMSQSPHIAVFRATVEYGELVIYDLNNAPSGSSTFTISNSGLGTVTILGYAWTQDNLQSIPT